MSVMSKQTLARRCRTAAAWSLVLAGAACAPMGGATPGPSFIVFYTPFSAALDPDATKLVAEAAKAAQAEPSRRVVVLGYADRLGSPESNRTLTRLRAEVVRDTLVADGVAASRISLQPKGSQGGDPGVESRRVEIELR